MLIFALKDRWLQQIMPNKMEMCCLNIKIHKIKITKTKITMDLYYKTTKIRKRIKRNKVNHNFCWMNKTNLKTTIIRNQRK